MIISIVNDFMDDFSLMIQKIKFDQNGLVAAIAQDNATNQVLMLAWMNRESIEITLSSGFATYFSRSRNKIWKKGETSGNVQKVISLAADCDYDSLLLRVEQQGPACHTGEVSCFFRNCSESLTLKVV